MSLIDDLRRTLDARDEPTIRGYVREALQECAECIPPCPEPAPDENPPCRGCYVAARLHGIERVLDAAERLPQTGDAIVLDPRPEEDE